MIVYELSCNLLLYFEWQAPDCLIIHLHGILNPRFEVSTTAPSVNIFKIRLEKAWAEVFPHLPKALTPTQTCIPHINSHNF